MIKKKYFVYIFTFFLITGCVNIKSKYVSPKIYTIQQAPLNNSIKTKISKSIFIKQFNVGTELETNKIAISDGNKLQYYNYHQWALPLDELLTNYTIDRFSNYSVFEKGVINSIFTISPDYILECNINSFKINPNADNNIEIILTANLYKYTVNSKDYQVYFSNVYSKKESSDDTLEKMITIIENIISEITDNVLKDIINIE